MTISQNTGSVTVLALCAHRLDLQTSSGFKLINLVVHEEILGRRGYSNLQYLLWARCAVGICKGDVNSIAGKTWQNSISSEKVSSKLEPKWWL